MKCHLAAPRQPEAIIASGPPKMRRLVAVRKGENAPIGHFILAWGARARVRRPVASPPLAVSGVCLYLWDMTKEKHMTDTITFNPLTLADLRALPFGEHLDEKDLREANTWLEEGMSRYKVLDYMTDWAEDRRWTEEVEALDHAEFCDRAYGDDRPY
jgi:hypothetical protein